MNRTINTLVLFFLIVLIGCEGTKPVVRQDTVVKQTTDSKPAAVPETSKKAVNNNNVNAIMKDGLKYLRDSFGKLDQAIVEFDKIMADMPDYIYVAKDPFLSSDKEFHFPRGRGGAFEDYSIELPAAFYAGYSYYRKYRIDKDKSKLEKAILYGVKALELDNKDSDFILTFLGDFYYENSDYQNALKSYEMIRKMPKNTDNITIANMGNSYYFMKDYEKAMEIFKKVFDESPGSLYLIGNNVNDLIANYEKSFNKKAPISAISWIKYFQGSAYGYYHSVTCDGKALSTNVLISEKYPIVAGKHTIVISGIEKTNGVLKTTYSVSYNNYDFVKNKTYQLWIEDGNFSSDPPVGKIKLIEE